MSRKKRSAPRFGVYRPTADDTFVFRGRDRPEAHERLRVASWNIHFGAGPTLDDARRFPREDVQRNLVRIGDVLHQSGADIVALQEVDRDSMRSGHIDQLEFLRDHTGLRHASFATTWDAAWVPYPVTAPPQQQYGRMWSGQAVLSRYPVLEQRRHALVQPARNGRVYNRFYLHRCVQEVVLDLGLGRTLSVFNVHLEAFDMANRRTQARALAALLQSCRGPGVCVGDFNTLRSDAPHFTGFEDEPETDFQGDDTLEVCMSGGWELAGDGAFTFPAERPNRRLDHLLVHGVQVEGAGLLDDPHPSSDHLPLFVTLAN
ncbi:MAG: hypothetical protein GY913_08590 [Proteobacteria bacterium]|nr:hypothetical protein [Pseudomonadota bacterium]MCP4916968.1 hypothetical protein [Pseudomonadota bacterium]